MRRLLRLKKASNGSESSEPPNIKLYMKGIVAMTLAGTQSAAAELPKAPAETEALIGLNSEECSKITTICLLVLTCLICCVAAYWLKSVLLPFAFAVFLNLSLKPVVEFLVKKVHIPKVLSIIVTLILAGIILVALTIVVSNSIMELTNNAEMYEKRFINLVDSFFEHPWIQKIHFTRTDVINKLSTESASIIGSALSAVLNSLFSLLSDAVIIGIYLIFLMFGTSINDEEEEDAQLTVWQDIYKSIKYYILVKLGISFIIGIVTWSILSILNVPMAYVLGLLAFALNFIPNVGPIIAVIIPIPMVLLSPDFTITTLILVIVLPTIAHLISGHLIEPNVIGESLDLSPVVILLTLMLAGVIWGPVGMLLSTPMTVAGKIILDRVDWAKPVASLMAGRPAPSKKTTVIMEALPAAPEPPSPEKEPVSVKKSAPEAEK